MRQPSEEPCVSRRRTARRTAALVLALTASLALGSASPATASPIGAATVSVRSAVPERVAARLPRPDLRASRTLAEPGDVISLRGTMPPESRAVLQRRSGRNDWTRVRRLTPSIYDDTFSTTVRATYGILVYRVVARRGRHLRHSDPVRVRVPRPTEVSADRREAAVAPGDEIRFDGRVEPALAGVRVELVRRTPRGSRVDATGRSAPDGTFSLRAEAPLGQGLRIRRYHVRVPARPRWQGSRSTSVPISIAPTTGLAVDRTPVSFEVGPEVGAHVDLPVDLVAGQPVTVDASFVTPHNRSYLDVSVLDPRGAPVGDAHVGDPYYGRDLLPTVTGTYTVRLTVDHEPSRVTGLVWVSAPRIVPIQVDGAPAELTGRLRPGQASWLTFERSEGDLFTVGCLSPVGCDDDQRLISVGHPWSELGQVGPTSQAMWNPPRTGAYYLEDTLSAPHQVWLTSANPEPLSNPNLPLRLDFTRPGQSRGVTLEVVAGQTYALSVIDRGLVDPLVEDPEDAVPQWFEVAGFGSPGGGYVHAGYQRGSTLTSFRALADGVWTIYVDPHGPAVGPMEIDVSEVAAPGDDRVRPGRS